MAVASVMYVAANRQWQYRNDRLYHARWQRQQQRNRNVVTLMYDNIM